MGQDDLHKQASELVGDMKGAEDDAETGLLVLALKRSRVSRGLGHRLRKPMA